MTLPNIDQVVVPRAKVVDYLLSQTHRDGRHKAAFFLRFGFTPDKWQEMAAALVQHAVDHGLTREEPSPFGRRLGARRSLDPRHPLPFSDMHIWDIIAERQATQQIQAAVASRK